VTVNFYYHIVEIVILMIMNTISTMDLLNISIQINMDFKFCELLVLGCISGNFVGKLAHVSCTLCKITIPMVM